MKDLIDKASTLVEVLPYIQKFRDAIVVIKFGGSAMEDHELTKKTMRDIVLLECIGMKPVVVHGGGKAISAKLKEMGIPTKFINGLRYTCGKTISVVDEVLHNTINQNLLEGIVEIGGKGQTVSGKDIITAERLFSSDPETGQPVDLGFVGNIVDVDTSSVLELADNDVVPVITPLGRGVDGQIYNINADIAACKVAEALRARKLVFLSDVPGILRDQNDESTVITSIKAGEIDQLIGSGVISGGMIPKIKSCLHALETGTNKVHMIDGRIIHALLLEIFTDEGIGTELVKG